MQFMCMFACASVHRLTYLQSSFNIFVHDSACVLPFYFNLEFHYIANHLII